MQIDNSVLDYITKLVQYNWSIIEDACEADQDNIDEDDRLEPDMVELASTAPMDIDPKTPASSGSSSVAKSPEGLLRFFNKAIDNRMHCN